MKTRAGRRAALLAVPLFVGLAFSGLLRGREVLWGDFVTWYFPVHHYAAERIWHGQLPLWNPYSDSGMPFMGEADHGTLYPPALLLHLVGPRRALFDALQLFTLAHLVLAGVNLYALARSLGCSRWASTLGGVAFGLSGAFAARAAHVALVCAQAWLPLALGGLQRALVARRWRTLAASALAVAMIALSGSPATLVVTTVGMVVVAAATGLFAPGRSSRLAALGRAGLFCGAALAVGLGIGAAQLVPMLELVRHSERGAYTYEDVASYALGPEALVMLLVPRFYGWLRYDALGYWGPPNFAELSGYAGVLTLALATLALALRRPARTAPWAALGLVGLWLALGRHGGVHWLLYCTLPVLGEMRAPGRYLLLWACGVAVLAALAVDRLAAGVARSDPRGRRALAAAKAALAAFGLLVLALAPALMRHMSEWQQPLFGSAVARTAAGTALAVLALWALRSGRAARAGLALCAALGGDLTLQWHGVGVEPRASADSMLRGKTSYERPMLADGTLFRVKSRYANPGDLMLRRLASDTGPGRHLALYQRFNERIYSNASVFLDLLNVKYFAEVTRKDARPGPSLIAPENLWLADGADVNVRIEPATEAEGVELVITAVGSGLPTGALVGEVALRGPDGDTVRPIRLGIETGDIEGGVVPSAAESLEVRYSSHPTETASLQGAFYRTRVEVPRQRLSRIALRHAGGDSKLIVRKARLLGAAPDPGGWRQIAATHSEEDFEVRLFENVDVLPRAWLARRHREAASLEEALGLVWHSGLDPREEVVIEAREGPVPPPAGQDASGHAEVAAYAPEEIRIAAEVRDAGAFLFLSEVEYPGWSAAVDGRPAPIQRAHGLFRAVWLEPGRHEVVFRYRPRSFAVGSAISAASLLALGVALAIRHRAASRSR